MTEEEKKVYICNMLLAEDRESYISNAMKAFPQGDRVELEKLADKVWGSPLEQAKKTRIHSDQNFPNSMFDNTGMENSQEHKGNMQKNNSDELLTSKAFLTSELTIIDQELKKKDALRHQ